MTDSNGMPVGVYLVSFMVDITCETLILQEYFDNPKSAKEFRDLVKTWANVRDVEYRILQEVEL